jgi:hypothetical protein
MIEVLQILPAWRQRCGAAGRGSWMMVHVGQRCGMPKWAGLDVSGRKKIAQLLSQLLVDPRILRLWLGGESLHWLGGEAKTPSMSHVPFTFDDSSDPM